MTTYSNLKYDHAFSSNATGTGSLTLISSQTASASASISFTSGIDSSFDEYIFKFINIHPSASSKFQMNLSTDGGSNYNVTKTTTWFYTYHTEDDATTDLAYSTANDLAQSTSYQNLHTTISTDNDNSLSGYLHLFSPSSTTYVKHFMSNLNMSTSTETFQAFVAGYGNTTSAINAIDFKFASGNIDDGTIILYGVK